MPRTPPSGFRSAIMVADMKALLALSGKKADARCSAARNNNWNTSQSSRHTRNISLLHPPGPGAQPDGALWKHWMRSAWSNSKGLSGLQLCESVQHFGNQCCPPELLSCWPLRTRLKCCLSPANLVLCLAPNNCHVAWLSLCLACGSSIHWPNWPGPTVPNIFQELQMGQRSLFFWWQSHCPCHWSRAPDAKWSTQTLFPTMLRARWPCKSRGWWTPAPWQICGLDGSLGAAPQPCELFHLHNCPHASWLPSTRPTPSSILRSLKFGFRGIQLVLNGRSNWR